MGAASRCWLLQRQRHQQRRQLHQHDDYAICFAAYAPAGAAGCRDIACSFRPSRRWIQSPSPAGGRGVGVRAASRCQLQLQQRDQQHQQHQQQHDDYAICFAAYAAPAGAAGCGDITCSFRPSRRRIQSPSPARGRGVGVRAASRGQLQLQQRRLQLRHDVDDRALRLRRPILSPSLASRGRGRAQSASIRAMAPATMPRC